MLLTDLAYPAAWRDEAAAVAGALKRYDRFEKKYNIAWAS